MFLKFFFFWFKEINFSTDWNFRGMSVACSFQLDSAKRARMELLLSCNNFVITAIRRLRNKFFPVPSRNRKLTIRPIAARKGDINRATRAR